MRFSNASPIHAGDGFKDMRGAALRIHLGENRYHDLLAASFPVSHAGDAWQSALAQAESIGEAANAQIMTAQAAVALATGQRMFD